MTQQSDLDKVINEAVGPDVLPLVKKMRHAKNISEFKLAASMKKEINTIRNMLYRLYNLNLVSFIRKKDLKKGWYIYYWTFNDKEVKHVLADIKKKKIEKINERLSRERTLTFFMCKNKCIRLEFEHATDFEYKCPECGALLEQEDNSQKIKELESELAKLQKELGEKTVAKKTKIKKIIKKKKPKQKKKKQKSK